MTRWLAVVAFGLMVAGCGVQVPGIAGGGGSSGRSGSSGNLEAGSPFIGRSEPIDSPLEPGIYTGTQTCSSRLWGSDGYDQTEEKTYSLTVVISDSGLPQAGNGRVFRVGQTGRETVGEIVFSGTIESLSASDTSLFCTSDASIILPIGDGRTFFMSGFAESLYQRRSSRQLRLTSDLLVGGQKDGESLTVDMSCVATLSTDILEPVQ